MATAPLTLRLEIDPTEEPISGRVSAPDGTSRPFRGWLELATVLEALLSAPAAPG